MNNETKILISKLSLDAEVYMLKKLDSILFVGTYPPRECGIATFTKDLSDSIEKKFLRHLNVKVLAMNNNGLNIYNYPKKVIYQISDTERRQYKEAAEKVNADPSIKLVSIQHEFGLFGSDYEERPGEYLLDFLKALKKPKIITFHSILPEPDFPKLKTVKEIAKYVDEIIVMTESGVKILREVYKIKTPIKVIPHGIPSVSFEPQYEYKKSLGHLGKLVLLSFGMISRGKGYEYVIESLPEVVKKYPNLVYIIVGATHPNIRKHEGESYRNELSDRIKELGLQKHVKFYNKYVTIDEIIQFIKASDVYISPSLTPEQITSGTLAYAMGCGRAAVSTPFLHAKDLINPDRGVLVDEFKNEESFKKALFEILSDKTRRKNIEQNNYEYTRKMTWQNVALAYGEIIREHIKIPEVFFEPLPKIDIAHMRKLTDGFGMIQFAKYTTPDIESGYTLDDNARALIVAAKLHLKLRDPAILDLIKTYFKYMKYVQDEDGKFYNVVGKNKKIDFESWSEDTHGRALEALGYLTSIQSIPHEIKREAEEMILKALPITEEINAPRAIAGIVTGLYYYNKESYSEEIIRTIKKFADRLVALFEQNSDDEWSWFEPQLTYMNSKIPESLLQAYMSTREKKYKDVGIKSLNFLVSKTFEKDLFIPIGQNGWYKKGGERAYFDQQPIDAASTIQTLALAYKLTSNSDYEKKALATFQWFLGRNTLKQVIYDEKTGGCLDGLDEKDANLNQGAESTLSYLNSRLLVEELT